MLRPFFVQGDEGRQSMALDCRALVAAIPPADSLPTIDNSTVRFVLAPPSVLSWELLGGHLTSSVGLCNTSQISTELRPPVYPNASSGSTRFYQSC
ncbi:hypothetical protein FRC03_008639 [Tulasnella sp. 419]|nr:hypothetical protein FRC03_008639 [Tulasnella sp. 419]